LDVPWEKGQSQVSHVLFVPSWVQDVSGTSAANTAIAAALNLAPVNANDYSSYVTLYDEIKVHNITVEGTFTYSVPSTVANARTIITWAYDPMDPTAPTSNVDQLSCSQHAGPWVVTSPFAPAATNSLMPSMPFEVSNTRGGFHRHKFVVPHGIARSVAFPAVISGEWAAMVDSLDYWGFLKTYAEAGGTAGVVAYRYFIHYDVSMRSRH